MPKNDLGLETNFEHKKLQNFDFSREFYQTLKDKNFRLKKAEINELQKQLDNQNKSFFEGLFTGIILKNYFLQFTLNNHKDINFKKEDLSLRD